MLERNDAALALPIELAVGPLQKLHGGRQRFVGVFVVGKRDQRKVELNVELPQLKDVFLLGAGVVQRVRRMRCV